MNGFINLIKPQGMSSAHAVSKVKKKTGLACGHMGTLDPLASGVLPVAIGHATRMFQYMLSKDKSYIATFIFGEERDTLDITGKVTKTTDKIPTEEEIKKVLSKFIGTVMQEPPKYSSKHVDGRKGYELARKGEEFTLKAVPVEINDVQLIEKINDKEYRISVDCKGGTYIRSLIRDIGYACSSLCTMTALERTKSGIFDKGTGIEVQTLIETNDLDSLIIPADTVVDFPKITLDEKQYKRILDGLFDDLGLESGLYRVYSNGFIGIGEVKDGVLKIKSYVR